MRSEHLVIRIGLFVEVLAIAALIAGIPVVFAAMIALIAATPTSAYTIYRIFRTDKSGTGVVDVVFLFLTWTMLPCMLLLHATDGVGENVFRLMVAVRVFSVVSIWRHLRQWQRSSNNSVIHEKSAQLTGVSEANDN